MTGTRRRGWGWACARVAGSVCLVWLILLLVGTMLQETFIFPRWVIPATEYAGSVPADATVFHVQTPDGTVPAWFFPADAGRAPEGLVVYLHGNGVVIDTRVPVARWLNEQGWNVLLPEYRGYGRAPGSPSQEAISDDVLDVVAQVQHAHPQLIPQVQSDMG